MFAPKVARAQTKASTSSINGLGRQRSTLIARPFGGGAVEKARMLQRSIGNQATLRLLPQRAWGTAGKQIGSDPEQKADPANPTAQGAIPGVSRDFGKIPLFPPDRHVSTAPGPELTASKGARTAPEGPTEGPDGVVTETQGGDAGVP